MGVPPLTAGPPLVLAPVDAAGAVVCVTGADGVRAGHGRVVAEGAVGGTPGTCNEMVQPRDRVEGAGPVGGDVWASVGGNSPRSVGLALRGRGPRASDRKVSGMNGGGGWER